MSLSQARVDVIHLPLQHSAFKKQGESEQLALKKKKSPISLVRPGSK